MFLAGFFQPFIFPLSITVLFAVPNFWCCSWIFSSILHYRYVVVKTQSLIEFQNSILYLLSFH